MQVLIVCEERSLAQWLNVADTPEQCNACGWPLRIGIGIIFLEHSVPP
jgi:hypothetical protein